MIAIDEIKVRSCNDAREVEEALQIILRVLGGKSATARKKLLHFFRLEQKKIRPEDIQIIILGKKIIGALQIIEKQLIVFGKAVPVDGITNVCIDLEYQKMGLGRRLMEWTNTVLEKRGKLLSILFARKAVDGFYPKFDFFGTSNFFELILNQETYEPKNVPTNIHIQKSPILQYYPMYHSFYKNTYKDIPFSFCRSLSWWKGLNQWLEFKIRPQEFINVFHNGKLFGYFICKENKIIEIASEKNNELLCVVLIDYARKQRFSELIFTIPAAHRCISYLTRFNHTLKSRRTWNGGHMIRIASLDKFLPMVKEFIKRESKKYFHPQIIIAALKIISKVYDNAQNQDSASKTQTFIRGIQNANHPILEVVGMHLQHTWSVIDEF